MTTRPDDDARHNHLTARLVAAHETLTEYWLAELLAPLMRTRLTVAQMRALTVLVLDGPTSSHRLAEVLGVSAATVTGVVDRLESAGMVTRGADPGDGRVRVVAASDAGTRAIRELAARDNGFRPDITARLTTEELQGLVTGLEGLLRVLRGVVGGVPTTDEMTGS